MGKVTNGSLPQVRKGKEKAADQQSDLNANPSENAETPGASRRSTRGAGDELVRSTAAASEFSADSPVSTLFFLTLYLLIDLQYVDMNENVLRIFSLVV